jgi:hypothetical protein
MIEHQPFTDINFLDCCLIIFITLFLQIDIASAARNAFKLLTHLRNLRAVYD